MRLIVGEGDAVEAIVYEEGSRQLEVLIGASIAGWGGPRGESYRIHEGTTLLSGRRVTGTVLDMSRARQVEDPAPGDWAFLVSGDSLQLLLSNPEFGTPEAPGAFRGWAHSEAGTLQWSDISVTWSEVGRFEVARRDVPSAWTVRSADGELGAELRTDDGHITAGEGEDPVLPVDALFIVSGSVRISGASYPVQGFFRHIRP